MYLLLPSASAWFGDANGVEPMLIAIDEGCLLAIEHMWVEGVVAKR